MRLWQLVGSEPQPKRHLDYWPHPGVVGPSGERGSRQS